MIWSIFTNGISYWRVSNIIKNSTRGIVHLFQQARTNSMYIRNRVTVNIVSFWLFIVYGSVDTLFPRLEGQTKRQTLARRRTKTLEERVRRKDWTRNYHNTEIKSTAVCNKRQYENVEKIHSIVKLYLNTKWIGSLFLCPSEFRTLALFTTLSRALSPANRDHSSTHHPIYKVATYQILSVCIG